MDTANPLSYFKKEKKKDTGCKICGGDKFFKVWDPDHPSVMVPAAKKNKRHHRTQVSRKGAKFVYYSKNRRLLMKAGFDEVPGPRQKVYECQTCGTRKEET